MKQIYILIGVPGAGKSTWTSLFLKNNKLRLGEFAILSRDTIREELGFADIGDKVILGVSAENEVTRVFNKKFYDALKSPGCEYIVIDNLNIRAKYRKNMLDYIAQHCDGEYEVTYVMFNTPIATCIKNRNGQVARSVMKKLWNAMQTNMREIENECDLYGIYLIEVDG